MKDMGAPMKQAHANARRELEARQSELMRQAAGPLAGMNIPGLKF